MAQETPATASIHPASNPEQEGAVAPAPYRDAMARLAAAVSIVTTDGIAGRAGFTATAVCSVTDTPATLLVCVKRDSSVSAAFQANGTLCVNTLTPGHEALSTLFGGKTPSEERFAQAEWITGRTGAPILADALVTFECRISRTVDVGTHAVLFCDVIAIADGQRDGCLCYVDRHYAAATGLAFT